MMRSPRVALRAAPLQGQGRPRPAQDPVRLRPAAGSARQGLVRRGRHRRARAGGDPMSCAPVATCEQAAEQVTRAAGLRLPRRQPGGVRTQPVRPGQLDDAGARAADHRRRGLRARARRTAVARRRPDQPGAVVRVAGLPLRHRAAAVLPGVVRPRQAVRLHLRPQRLHGAVHVGPAAALHHRDLPGAEPSWRTSWCGCSASSSTAAPLVGSIAVAFVCQVFYEIFDQLGPQLKWWALERRQRQGQPPRARLGADEQHAAVRLGVVRRDDVPGRQARRLDGSTAGRAAAGR